MNSNQARLIAGAAVLVLGAFVAGDVVGRRSTSAASADPRADGRTPLAEQAGRPLVTDINAMSPEERASRLFDRVMWYGEQGKLDSARFFAPMAIQAEQMITPIDAHVQYDIGAISATIGDVARARAESDTILAARPTNLLGLVLAIRSAELANDLEGAARYRKRLVSASAAERAAPLPGYTEHAHDIDAALLKAGLSR